MLLFEAENTVVQSAHHSIKYSGKGPVISLCLIFLLLFLLECGLENCHSSTNANHGGYCHGEETSRSAHDCANGCYKPDDQTNK